MSANEEKVELEVARYALRTFRFSLPDGVLFRFSLPDVVLRSVSQGGYHWNDGTCTAQCVSPRVALNHEVPGLNCTCGIYGCLSLWDLMCQYPLFAGAITAVIAAEGPTVIGPKGLRTAYARVVAYHVDDQYPTIAQAAQRQFTGAAQCNDIFDMLATYQLPQNPRALCFPTVDRRYLETVHEGKDQFYRPKWWNRAMT